MRKIIHVAIWIFISVIVQLSILMYLDKYYLKTETSFKVKKIVQQSPKKQKIEIQVSKDGTENDSSFDGKYFSYLENGNIVIVNTEDNQKKVISPENGDKIYMYKWLSDRNRMYIVEKTTKSNENIVLYYYDASKDVKGKVQTITDADEDTDVKNMEVAPMTNVSYIKVNRSTSRSEIFSIDAMNDVRKVHTTTSSVGNINTLTHKDELIYENSYDQKVYSSATDSEISFKNSKSQILLSVDNSDNVYIGDVVNNQVDKIFYGNMDTPTDKWKTINVLSPCDRNNIFISSSGDVIVNNSAKNEIQSLNTNKVTAYKGTLLKITNIGVLSVQNGNLVKTKLN